MVLQRFTLLHTTLLIRPWKVSARAKTLPSIHESQRLRSAGQFLVENGWDDDYMGFVFGVDAVLDDNGDTKVAQGV